VSEIDSFFILLTTIYKNLIYYEKFTYCNFNFDGWGYNHRGEKKKEK